MGYIGQVKSYRSQRAINEGLLTKNQLKAWQKRAIEQGAVQPCEWHHTGKYFSKTNYYNPNDFDHLNPNDFLPIKTSELEQKETWYVLVSAKWGGTKNHPKIIGQNVVVKNKITTAQKMPININCMVVISKHLIQNKKLIYLQAKQLIKSKEMI